LWTLSAKTSTNVPVSTQGTNAAKKIVGRKRGIITDTLGLLLSVIVAAASVSDKHHRRQPARRRDHAPFPGLPRHGSTQGFKTKVVECGASLGIDVEIRVLPA